MLYLIWLILVIGIVISICKKLSFSKLETILTSIFFILSPFQLERFGHIEQFHFWILASGIYILLYLQSQSRFFHLVQTSFLIIGAFLLMHIRSGTLIEETPIIDNTIKLFSLEFIFFRNILFTESNPVGVFIPESIFLFFAGINKLIDNRKSYSFLIALAFVNVISIFMSDSLLVGSISWFAIIIGFGIQAIIQLYIYSNRIIKVIIILYGFIVFFGEVQSIHYIFVHYALNLLRP